MEFKIGNTSYANRIIAGTYAINSKDIYESFTDASSTAHRRLKRRKITGKVDMFFKDIAEFNIFLDVINRNKDENLAVDMTVSVNNLAEDKEIKAFLDFEPVRDRDAMWNDYMMKYTLNIEER